MWRNVQSYKSKCAEQAAKYEEEAKRLQMQIDALVIPSVDIESFKAYLTASGLNFGRDTEPEKILVETQRLQAEYDKVIRSWPRSFQGTTGKKAKHPARAAPRHVEKLCATERKRRIARGEGT